MAGKRRRVARGRRAKQCFVISPIGEKDSPERRRADQILNHVIRPAGEALGYRVERADDIEKPGTITNQIIQRLLHDDLVIADLTGPNANVFYELAVRHAVKKPVIHLIEQGQRIPFDIQATRTIVVNHHDLDSARDCRLAIEGQIQAIEEDPDQVDNPIANAVQLDIQLRQIESSSTTRSEQMDAVLRLLLDIRSSLRPSPVPEPVDQGPNAAPGVVALNWGTRVISYDPNNLSDREQGELRQFLRNRVAHGWRVRNIRSSGPLVPSVPARRGKRPRRSER